jgi:thymidylate synthase (FAD)
MEAVQVLDHGSIRLVGAWGSDEEIIESARMSTGKGFNGWGEQHDDVCPATRPNPRFPASAFGGECDCTPKPGDEKLLRFLWENHHASPFEMGGATFEVKAPIFVFREWHRHRVPFGYNEMSARYTPLPDENYIPTVARLLIGSDGRNRQAGTIAGAGVLGEAGAIAYREALVAMYGVQEGLYQKALADGVPKELARVHLPVGRYSRMRATGNLRGWLGFLALRSTAKNPSAQWEIRQYADALWALLAERFPRTLALFAEEPVFVRRQKEFLRSLLLRARVGDLPPDVMSAIGAVLDGAAS